MAEIVMPKLNNNDVSYVLVEWLRPDGAFVRAGEPIALVETSKSTMEVEAEAEGYLVHARKAGDECAVGEVFAYRRADASTATSAAELELVDNVDASGGAHDTVAGERFVVTEPARRLIHSGGVLQEDIVQLGLKVVRAADVRKLLASRTSPQRQPPAAGVRQAIARVVEQAHREIPDAFIAIRVVVDSALEVCRRTAQGSGPVVGVPELMICALGRLDSRFPEFYGRGTGHERRADIGVTLDAGAGLFMPVIRGAGELAATDAAERLMSLRKRAARNAFEDGDLAEADIGLALHHEADVVIAHPIIFPGQTCMVSLAGVVPEAFSNDGQVAIRSVVHVGAAFDHRAVDGARTMAFLRAVKSLV